MTSRAVLHLPEEELHYIPSRNLGYYVPLDLANVNGGSLRVVLSDD